MKKALFLLLIFPIVVFAQKAKKLEIVHADDLIFDKSSGNNAKRLIGNVVFKQEQTFMYCDSAYFYSETNSFEAFNNIRIVEGNDMSLTGDVLNYDGNSKYAKLRGNIKLKDAETTLTTNYLDYNREDRFAFFQGGGEIINTSDDIKLTSGIGYYFPDTKFFHFKDSVVLISDDYTIKSDTLHQNNASNITYFYGPTEIWSDSTYIYCERGFYDKDGKASEFVKNAFIQNENQSLKADSIRYDLENNLGWMHGNAEITDTTEDFIVKGNYAIHNKLDSTSLVTGQALLIQIFDEDSFFLHGDTLFSEFDSTRKHRIIHAYRKVKFFKEDLSGKCDSLVFSNADSLIKLFYDPIIWVDANQLTAQYIQIKNYDGKIKWMEMVENSFIITQEDSVKFNQISGNNMMNIFRDGALVKIDVKGNGKTMYYAKEEDGSYIGVNDATAEDLIIFLDSNAVEKIKFYKNPTSKLTPLEEVNEKDLRLPGFDWRIREKPLKPEDVFIWE